LPVSFEHIPALLDSSPIKTSREQIKLVHHSATDVILAYTVERDIVIRRYLENGEELLEKAVTMDRHSVRLFRISERTFLSLIEPGRSFKVIVEILDRIFPQGGYFLDPLEINTPLIQRHIAWFDSAKLVSAKIKDFEVYSGAVGRLEVSSHQGLIPDIAPFLKDKFYRIDSFTYDVTQKFVKGSVQYSKNGTIRISGSLVESGFPAFEACLGQGSNG
jgi:hypothetical protein